MNLFRTWNDSARTTVTRLDRLRRTLNDLSARLRADVAEAVAREAGGMVRDAIRSALDGLVGSAGLATPVDPPYGREPALFGSPEHDRWDGAARARHSNWDEYEYDADRLDSTYDHPSTPLVAPPLPLALTAGVRSAAWWLRRRTFSRRSVLGAVCVGLLGACAARMFGPLTGVLLTLAESAAHTDALSNVLHGQ